MLDGDRARRIRGILAAEPEAGPAVVIAENSAGKAEVGDGKEQQVLVAALAALVAWASLDDTVAARPDTRLVTSVPTRASRRWSSSANRARTHSFSLGRRSPAP